MSKALQNIKLLEKIYTLKATRNVLTHVSMSWSFTEFSSSADPIGKKKVCFPTRLNTSFSCSDVTRDANALKEYTNATHKKRILFT